MLLHFAAGRRPFFTHRQLLTRLLLLLLLSAADFPLHLGTDIGSDLRGERVAHSMTALLLLLLLLIAILQQRAAPHGCCCCRSVQIVSPCLRTEVLCVRYKV